MKRRGFVHRVVWVGIAGAGLGALVAALVAIVAADRLLQGQSDQRLTGAVIELAGELDEDEAERRPSVLEREIADENDELAPSGISLSVFEGKTKVAGVGPSRTPDVGDCETQGQLGVRIRSCSKRYGDWVLVASQRSDAPQLRWFYLLAAVGACMVGAGAGGSLGYWVARWAIQPLKAMTQQLQTVVPGHDSSLGESSDCVEVEAVRLAIEGLLGRIRVLLGQAERFAANAAHELRSPLAALSMDLELLAESLESREREYASGVHQRVLRLARLVERLLVSALPTENLSHGFETVSMEEVVLATLDALPASSRERVTFTSGPEGLVWGDFELLRLLVHNAVENALTHSAGGQVVVRVLEECTEVVLEIEDDGPGISDEFRSRVFEPFFRIPGTATQGHGLGLALIGHIAAAHSGKARFADRQGGATLRILLPTWTTRPPS